MDNKLLSHFAKILVCLSPGDSPPETLLADLPELVRLAQENSSAATNQHTLPEGKLCIRTSCEGRPVPAQIKLFKHFSGAGCHAEAVADGTVDFIREQTRLDGEVILSIPEGHYLLEITKGPVYSTARQTITIESDRTTVLIIALKRLIDLNALGIYCGDLHHHSIYSSPLYGGTDRVADSPQDVMLAMLAAGLDFGALSDHHNILNHAVWRALETDFFTPIRSKEISTTNGHVAAHGAVEEVVYRIPGQEERTDEVLRGEFTRVANQIKSLGGFPVINHPREFQTAIAFPERFTDMIDIFEGIEIWNGSLPMLPGLPNDAAFKLWLSLMKSGVFIPAVAGSDTHNIRADDFHGLFDGIKRICCFIQENSKCLPYELIASANFIERVASKLVPVWQQWVQSSFGTGDVRNCVFVEGPPTEKNILRALRQGRNVVTNGPILLPTVNGKGPGESIQVHNKKASIAADLYAVKPVNQLAVIFGDQKSLFPLQAEGKEGDLYRYRFDCPDFAVGDAGFMLFVADSGFMNMAITNPVYLLN